MAKYHLAILKRRYLEAILGGEKTIESRFTRTNRPPIGQVSAGDTIFFKVVSGPVCIKAMVERVKNFEHLTSGRISNLKKRYNPCICGSNGYWQSKAGSRYGVLVWLKDIKAISPLRIEKKDRLGWVVLSRQTDFGLLNIS